MIQYSFGYEEPDQASLEQGYSDMYSPFFDQLSTPPTGILGAEAERSRPTDPGYYDTGAVRPPGETILVGSSGFAAVLLIGAAVLLLHLLGVI